MRCKIQKVHMSIDINIDSTSLGTSACILNFKRTVIDGYKSTPGASMIYGVAMHKFIDTMYKTSGNFPLARDAALRSFDVKKLAPSDRQSHLADPKHLISSCYNLWTSYVESEGSYDVLQVPTKCWTCAGDGRKDIEDCPSCKGTGAVDGPATEITFRIPFYTDDIIRVHLCGTIDTIGKFKNGCFAIRDWKTTSSYDKDNYMSSYRLSRQLRIYALACKLEASNYPDSILGKIGATKMGAFIDAIFIKAKSNDNEYVRGEVYQFSEEDLTKTNEMIVDFCERLSKAVEWSRYPKEGIINGTCLGQFGRCRFWNVCASNEAVGEMLLARDFTKKDYNPLAFGEP